MRKYVVYANQWCKESKSIVKVMIGQFKSVVCARLFAEAYESHFSSECEIVEYVRE